MWKEAGRGGEKGGFEGDVWVGDNKQRGEGREKRRETKGKREKKTTRKNEKKLKKN